MNLLIVESPNKTRKIAEYVGPGWKVEASSGHIRDLPVKEMGVGPSPSYKPKYVVTEGSHKRVARLKKLAAEADAIFLATDMDREGEAIAFHLIEVLKLKSHKRVVFNEITKTAIQKALKNPGQLNRNLVYAQEGRRILDRLVGYRVSPALSDNLGTKASAGRVQSVAVRLVVERERAIRDFSSTDHYGVQAHFEDDQIGRWTASWDFSHLLDAGVTETDPESEPDAEPSKLWLDRESAEGLVSSINSQPGFTVSNVVKKKRQRKAPCAFTTSLLQQAASSALKINPEETMKLAQKLFEAGHISYHRTDSPNLSEDAINDIRKLVGGWEQAKGITGLLPASPNTWKSKGSAQEAHEAIRPTDITQMALADVTDAEAQLYQLIWKRAVASQMSAAVYDTTTITLLSDAEHQPFSAKGEILVFPGWRFLSAEDAVDQEKVEESGGEQDQSLPNISPGIRIQCAEAELKESKTRPTSRFTEATLIKALESAGVGRPSTYAAIMGNIKARGYIAIKSRKIFAEQLGEQVVDALVGQFQFMEVAFTREAEECLDRIAQGHDTYSALIDQYDKLLSSELSTFSRSPSGDAGPQYDCPKCGSALRSKSGKRNNSRFWGCSGYPDCSVTFPDINGEPDLAYQPPKVETSDIDCPKCNKGKMNRREGKFGSFWACNAFPKCKNSAPDDNGTPDWAAAEAKAKSSRTKRPVNRKKTA